MVTGGRYDGGAQGISVRKTIQSIKEIVGNHSEADIYAALKESNMDPNETAQKLLNEDPFHEVKRKKDKRKENTGYKASTEGRVHSEHNLQRARSYSSWDRNARGGSQTRKTAPGAGVSREFRIVRDNRVNQKTTENLAANKDAKTEPVQNSSLGIQQVNPDTVERSSGGILTGQKHSAAKNSEGQYQGLNRHVGYASGHAKNAESSVGLRQSVTDEILVPLASSSRVGDGQSSPQMHSATGGVTNSHIGVYSSSSDPVHVPSPDSRSAGTVGAIGSEVRAVGARKLSFDRPAGHPTVSNSSLLIPQMRQGISSSKESISHSSPVSKSSSQTPGLEPVIQSMPLVKSLPSSHYNMRLQQPVTHQKATQPSMEWKPKTTQKPSLSNEEVHEVPSLPSSDVDGSVRSSEVEAAGLSDKVAQVNISRVEHVIIPHHLRVPESERLQLTFGSFESGFQLNKDVTSSKASHSVELQHDESSMSVCTTVQASSGEDESADDQASLEDSQGRNSPSEPPELAAESGQPQPENDESNPTNMESYADISVVQGHNPPYISSEPPPLQNSPSPPSFSAYIPQANYGMPFFRTTVEDNAHVQNFVSTSENDSPRSALMQQQQLVQQQQQPMAQMFPPVHVSHLPNFVPYRHIFSPVYGPPMAMPNYTGNPTYPHPSNANNYLLMPGGTSHLNPAAVKYTNSQYKPVPTGTLPGYGNFTNPAGYNMATPGTIGNTTNLDDSTRIKYKDSNPYTSNQQAETPDIWIQTPRELPGMQSTPYYNLTGQPPQPAFLPAHAGHASFSPTPQPHVYPGLYHTPQQPPIANPHHLIPQQVPPGIGAGVGVGVGMAAPGPQVGTYQQQQMGHLNWSSNF
ncbi:GBF-interacting protein 1-like isoform X2 [Dioscorea cayenensis subsp. rotundata]|uniref:GBF-interacting protein 1-like isoform X2 n=1 Tax=Dioscorea cayennensis subsp. rotundata TaxID=55577 RepID=A0AB40BDV9_DIOCR|nr:GBF-interacting protein 1-like isoform X2 [Dioscorea cayenensis subsp. rotundata]